MIKLTSFKGKKLAIFGLGLSNIATAKALLLGGAEIIAFDDELTNCDKAAKEGFFIQDLRFIDWQNIDALILAPGVPLHYPVPHWSVVLAQENGVEIIGDIELFLRERQLFLQKQGLSDFDCPFIAITGTNGKSTTTHLTTYLLKKAGLSVEMGGNIGTPILALAPFLKGRCYVIECSSFQIDLTPSIAPSIGVLLNLTPDHIDRHKDFFTYQKVKERIIFNAHEAILAIDDKVTEAIAQTYLDLQKTKAVQQYLTLISTQAALKSGYYAKGEDLFYKKAPVEDAKKIADLRNAPSLRGEHNQQNTLAALAILNLLMPNFDAQKALNAYQSLAHRMEIIGEKDKILFVNDSKATNAEAAAAALKSFEPIYWILGGVAKAEGIMPLKPFFHKIKKGYLIGEASPLFASMIGDAFPYVCVDSLKDAVLSAYSDAKKDNLAQATILLSPACASYDQFPNYMVRGDVFKTLVKALIE